MRYAFLFAALVAGGGCGGGSNGNDGGGDGSGSVVDLKMKADLWKPPEPAGCVKGVVQDEAGKVMAMESVLACSQVVCLYGTTGADGKFEVCGLHLDPLAIKTEEKCKAMPRKAAAMAQALLTKDGDSIDIGVLVVPDQNPGVALAPMMAMPQTLMVGDGLTLTIISKDFQYPLGGDDCTIAGHLVPADKHFNFKIPDGGTILAAYALSPFDGQSKSKIGIKAPVMAKPDSEVHFWTVSILNGLLDPQPAKGKADAQGMSVSTNPGEGIAQLTWLIITGTKP